MAPQKLTVNIETTSGEINIAAKTAVAALANEGINTDYNKVLGLKTAKPTFSFNPKDRQFVDNVATILNLAGVPEVALRPDRSLSEMELHIYLPKGLPLVKQ